MKLVFSKIIKFIILLNCFHHIKSDYYTSVVSLEKLLNVEKYFIKAVEIYFDNVEKINTEIERFLDEVELEHEKISKNANKYFGEPINSYKIIKRIVYDWQRLGELVKFTPEYEAYNASLQIWNHEYISPTIEDLQGAARGLIRLQQMYKLETTDIAKGYLKDFKYSVDLTAEECFEMGKSLYDMGEYLYASEWFIESMQKLDKMMNEKNVQDSDMVIHEYPFVTQIDILEFLGAALYNAGNRKLASLMNLKLLQIDPKNEYGLANKDVFYQGVKAERRTRVVRDKPIQKSKSQDLYEKVCSGELQLTAKEQRPLRCRYVTNNVPFYFIGPFKMEELNREPFIAFYHQTIYDSEIEYIIKQVENRLVRSKIGLIEVAHHDEIRTSKNSWLWFEQHKFLNKIYQRLEDITGLSLASGEPLQVANYGIGGHFGPHYDFKDYKDNDNAPARGNRILTAIFYINEVELGGATAFPYLHIAVPPIKHSLLMWHNMHKSLEYDYRMKHAGCPVLKGSKWICNEWFHAVGQEFKRPCDLTPDGVLSESYYEKDILYSKIN